MSERYTPQDILQIAKQAGTIILKYYQDDFKVDLKSDQTPVTIADQKASRFIIEQLNALSELPVISEEEPVPDFNIRSQWQSYWLIDPLDGTKEFIQHRPEFTVNIALIQHGKPILGVVVAPAMNECFVGYSSAFNGESGSFRYIDGEMIPIQSKHEIDLSPEVLSGRTRPKPRLDKLMVQIPEAQLTELGSSLKICRIAEGQADLYPRFGPTSEWDTAAAQVILEQAGGQLTDLHGNTLRYNTKESLLNPDFLAAVSHDAELLSQMRELSQRISI